LAIYQPWLKEVAARAFQPVNDAEEQGYTEEQILAAQAANHQRRTFGRIPREAREPFVAAVLPALQVLIGALDARDDKRFTRALACFLIVPQFALVKSNHTISGMELAQQVYGFFDGPNQRHPRSRSVEEHKSDLNEEHKSDLNPEVAKALRRAKYLASEGRFSRASHTIQQAAAGRKGVLEPNDETIAQLRNLHPPASRTPDDCPVHAPAGLSITRPKLLKAADRIANGSAADVFGWTGELLRHLLHDRRCSGYIIRLVQAIRDGQVGEDARHWLLLSWLIALDKGDNKVRPIAGGTVLVKLTAAYLMETMDSAKNIFRESGVQCGIFMPDGAKVITHFTQMALELDPENIVLKVDFKNAFNSLSRACMLQVLFQRPELVSFHRLAHWIYSKPSTLLVKDAKGRAVASISSEQGVRQGCVLGSLLFATATRGIFIAIKEEFPALEVLAYLDDVVLVGKPDVCLSALDQLTREAATIRLEVQPAKCQALVTPSARDNDTISKLEQRGVQLMSDALPLLGSVVGVDRAVLKTWVERQVEDWSQVIPVLARPELPAQLALLLARWNLVAKPSSLTRALPPDVTVPALAGYEEAIIHFVGTRFDRRFEGFSRKMLQLPQRLGGVGFCSPAVAAPHAFVAGVATALSGFLGKSNLIANGKFPVLKHTSTLRALEATLHEHYSAPSSLKLPELKYLQDVDSFSQRFVFPSNSSKLQSRLMTAVQEREVDMLRAEPLTPQQKALWASRETKTSGLVWRAFPLVREYELNDYEMQFLLSYATGTDVPDLPDQCGCKKVLSLEHAVHCHTTKLTRHNMLQHRLAAFAREHNVTTQQNARLVIGDRAKRQEPDIIFYFPTPLETDVTVVNPCCPTRLMQTLSSAGAALRSKCKEKTDKYLAGSMQRGRHFAPLAFETHGRFGPPVNTLLLKMAANLRDEVGLAVKDMTLDLAVTLVRGNALCARNTIARARARRDLARAVAS
jgi:Reverse transcriptase (RNA-dependent DNA polymerase)